MRTSLFKISTIFVRAIRTSLVLVLTFAALAAHADKHPDDEFNTEALIRITRQINQTQREIADLTMKVDLIFGYAFDPEETIRKLSRKLDQDQIRIGQDLQQARRETPPSEEKIAKLQDLSRQNFDEIIQVRAKRRLPKWLIGESRYHIAELVERKTTAVSELATLEAEYKRIINTSITTKTCAVLFR